MVTTLWSGRGTRPAAWCYHPTQLCPTSFSVGLPACFPQGPVQGLGLETPGQDLGPVAGQEGSEAGREGGPKSWPFYGMAWAPQYGQWVGRPQAQLPLLVLQEEDILVRCVSVLGNLADQLYYPCEHIAWAADARILHVDSARWWALSTAFWGLSLLLGIAR